MNTQEHYDRMILGVSTQIADDLEDSAIRHAFTSTEINTTEWSERVRRDIETLVRDILAEETLETTRLQEKRLTTAKEFTLNSLGSFGVGNCYARFVLETLIAYFFNRTRPTLESLRS
jgi:hypothetical protein